MTNVLARAQLLHSNFSVNVTLVGKDAKWLNDNDVKRICELFHHI